MLPSVIIDLITSYVDSMDEGSSLPTVLAVKKLVKRSDVFAMNELGFVMGLPTYDMERIRCRVILNNDFLFYFRLTAGQRVRFIRGLKRGIVSNAATASLVWLFLQGPNLYRYKEYREYFTSSLLVKFLGHFCD